MVGLAVAGRVGQALPPAAPPASSSAAEIAVADRPARAALVRPAVRTVPAGHRREEGTDGLMGRLPFGLPDDTPFVRVVPTNRFVIDDVLAPRGTTGPRLHGSVRLVK